MQDTIAALATAPGMAALGIIRLSGPLAAEICDRCFQPKQRFPKPSQMEGYTIAYGSWHDVDGQELDQIILSAFRAPASYTGEDLYELSFHGGSQVRRSLLESIYSAGARPAEPGEFSKRAFLNGKMDLIEAEAVMDLISAETEKQQELALQEMSGSLSKAVNSLKSELFDLLGRLENILEFSEENAEEADLNFLASGIDSVLGKIDMALEGWKQGKVISDAFKVTILGLTNAGKSSLLNSLMGEERAIVSNISGTTRDTVEARLQFDGIPVLLTDTAGFRETSDVIEKEGIERALKAANRSDLVFWLHDPIQKTESLRAFKHFQDEFHKDIPVLEIIGKSDLPEANDLAAELNSDQVIFWSKQDLEAPSKLRESIIKQYESLGSKQTGGVLIHNIRHKRLLDQARESLVLAKQSLADIFALDMTSAMIRSAEEALSAISGSELSDQLVDEIFSRFCVGK